MPQERHVHSDKAVKPANNDLIKGNPGREWTPPKPSQGGNTTGTSQSQTSSSEGCNTNDSTSKSKP